MRIFFLHGRLYSPEGDGGGGGAAAATTDTNTSGNDGSAAGGGSDASAMQAAVAAQNQQATFDVAGGVPEGWGQSNVSRGTSDAAPADKQPDAAPDAAAQAAAAQAAAAAAAPPPFDFKTLGLGKYENAEAVNAALATAEANAALLADPQVQALVNMAKEPEKAADFFHELRRDFAAEAAADPYKFLLSEFKANNPDYTPQEAEAYFKREYNDKYPNIGINDPEDEDYQESKLLLDGAIRRVVTKRSGEQQQQREKLSADLAKLTPTETAQGGPLVTDEEIAAHVAAAQKSLTSLTTRTAKVDILDAQGVKTGEETVTLPMTPEATKKVEDFMADTYGYFEQAGITDDKGNFNYDAYRDFGYKAINYDADMQAAVQRGIALGVARGAAALIQPNDNPNAQPNASQQQPAASAPGAQAKSGYWERQNQAAQNISDL